jgi:uncharacterized membrane protein
LNRSTTRHSIGWALVVTAIVTFALALRCYQLGDENLWIDEVHQVRVAAQHPREIVENYRPGAVYGTTDQAPLSVLITHFFVSGDRSEARARLPSAIFSALGVLWLFLAARMLVPIRTAIVAALFMAICPIDVWYGQEARWYAQWSSITTLSYVLLVRATQTTSLASWTAFALATLVNLYTFIYSLFALAAQGLSFLWLRVAGRLRRGDMLRFAAVVLLVIVAGLPVLWVVISSTDLPRVGATRQSTLAEVPYTVYAFAVGFTFGPSVTELHMSRSPVTIVRQDPLVLLVPAVVLPILILGVRDVGKDRGVAPWLIPWLVAPPAMVLLLAFTMPNLTYNVRYVLASLPAFVLLLSIGVCSLRGAKWWLGFGAVAALMIWSLLNHFNVERYDKEDVRGALAHVRAANSEAPKQIVVVGQIEYAIPYYGTDSEFSVVSCGSKSYTDYPQFDVRQGAAEDLFRLIDPSRESWLIVGRDWKGEVDHCLEFLAGRFEARDEVGFAGVRVVRLEPRCSPQ